MLDEFLTFWAGNPLAWGLRRSLPLFVAVQTLHLLSVVSLAGLLVLRAGRWTVVAPAIPPRLIAGLLLLAAATVLLLSMPEARDYAANPFLPWKLAGLALLLPLVWQGQATARAASALLGLAMLVLGRSMGIFV